MIDARELAICKQRGHDPQGQREKWERCKHCGMWTRTISVKEEREDDPPESEQDSMYSLQRHIAELDRTTSTLKEKNIAARKKKAK